MQVEIYLVMASVGEYSDRDEYPVMAYFDEAGVHRDTVYELDIGGF